jgi:hypothetical protein
MLFSQNHFFPCWLKLSSLRKRRHANPCSTLAKKIHLRKKPRKTGGFSAQREIISGWHRRC